MRIFGFPLDSQPTFEDVAECIHPEDRLKARAAMQNALKTGEPYQIEIRIIRNDDREERHILSMAEVEKDQNGKPFRLFGINQDITDRKNSENELRQRQNLLNRIFEILPVGLWFTDKEGKLLSGNPAGVKIWGAEPHVLPSEYGIFKARRLPSGEEIKPEDWALAHT